MTRKLLKLIEDKWHYNFVDPCTANCYTTMFLLPDGRIVKCDHIHFTFAQTIGMTVDTLLRAGVARIQNVDDMGIEIKQPMTYKQRESILDILSAEDHNSLAIECTKRGRYAYTFHRAYRPLRNVPKQFDKFFES